MYLFTQMLVVITFRNFKCIGPADLGHKGWTVTNVYKEVKDLNPIIPTTLTMYNHPIMLQWCINFLHWASLNPYVGMMDIARNSVCSQQCWNNICYDFLPPLWFCECLDSMITVSFSTRDGSWEHVEFFIYRQIPTYMRVPFPKHIYNLKIM